jgi:hypothetical protein
LRYSHFLRSITERITLYVCLVKISSKTAIIYWLHKKTERVYCSAVTEFLKLIEVLLRVKHFFIQCSPISERTLFFFSFFFCRRRSFVCRVKVSCRCRWVWSAVGVILKGENRSKRRLTPIPLAWTTWRAPTNASNWRMGFNSAFRGLTCPTASLSTTYLLWTDTG